MIHRKYLFIYRKSRDLPHEEVNLQRGKGGKSRDLPPASILFTVNLVIYRQHYFIYRKSRDLPHANVDLVPARKKKRGRSEGVGRRPPCVSTLPSYCASRLRDPLGIREREREEERGRGGARERQSERGREGERDREREREKRERECKREKERERKREREREQAREKAIEGQGEAT